MSAASLLSSALGFEEVDGLLSTLRALDVDGARDYLYTLLGTPELADPILLALQREKVTPLEDQMQAYSDKRAELEKGPELAGKGGSQSVGGTFVAYRKEEDAPARRSRSGGFSRCAPPVVGGASAAMEKKGGGGGSKGGGGSSGNASKRRALKQAGAVVLLPGRVLCRCNARRHELFYNCLSCGLIVCEQQRDGPCLVCGNDPHVPRPPTAASSASTVSTEEAQAALDAAEAHTRRLLEFDRSAAKRTTVIDDQTEWYSHASADAWLNENERRAALEASTAREAEKEKRRRELRLIIDVQGKRILRDDSGLDEAPDARHGESDDTEPGEMLDARTVAMVSRRALATTRASDESSSSIACAPVSPETRERLRKNNEAGSGRLANPTLARRALFVDRSSFDQRSSGGGKGRAGSGSNGLRSNACCGSGSTLNASREPLREAAQAEGLCHSVLRVQHDNPWLDHFLDAELPPRVGHYTPRGEIGCIDAKLDADSTGASRAGALHAPDAYAEEGGGGQPQAGDAPSMGGEGTLPPGLKGFEAPVDVPTRAPPPGLKTSSSHDVVHRNHVHGTSQPPCRAPQALPPYGPLGTACLSLHQPWASLLVHGIKRVEGRSWQSDHRGPLWIAATAKEPEDSEIMRVEQEYIELHQRQGWPLPQFPSAYPTAALLGCVRVTECKPHDNWIQERGDSGEENSSAFVFLCERPRRLPVPIRVSGSHKIWRLEPSLASAAEASLNMAEA